MFIVLVQCLNGVHRCRYSDVVLITTLFSGVHTKLRRIEFILVHADLIVYFYWLLYAVTVVGAAGPRGTQQYRNPVRCSVCLFFKVNR